MSQRAIYTRSVGHSRSQAMPDLGAGEGGGVRLPRGVRVGGNRRDVVRSLSTYYVPGIALGPGSAAKAPGAFLLVLEEDREQVRWTRH